VNIVLGAAEPNPHANDLSNDAKLTRPASGGFVPAHPRCYNLTVHYELRIEN
jgi:hypothetical protein